MIVKLAIKPGWHIYANPAGVAELSPSRLELHPESRKLVTIEQPVYPAGVVKVLASSGTEKVRSLRKRSRDQGRLQSGKGRQARFGRDQVHLELPGLQRQPLPGAGFT